MRFVPYQMTHIESGKMRVVIVKKLRAYEQRVDVFSAQLDDEEVRGFGGKGFGSLGLHSHNGMRWKLGRLLDGWSK